MHMLQNVVHPMDNLRQVKNQADQLQAFHHKVMSYDSYCNLLLSAASNSDAHYVPKGRTNGTAAKSPRRNVYTHDLANYGDDVLITSISWIPMLLISKPTFISSIPSCLYLLEIGTPLRPCLTSQQWHSLHPDAQATFR